MCHDSKTDRSSQTEAQIDEDGARRERERNMNFNFHGAALMSDLLYFLEKQSVGLPAPMGMSLL